MCQRWASEGGENGHLPTLKIGIKDQNKKIIENMKSAAHYRFTDLALILAMTIYLPVSHSRCTLARLTILVSCSDELAVHSCQLLCLQRQGCQMFYKEYDKSNSRQIFGKNFLKMATLLAIVIFRHLRYFALHILSTLSNF